MSATLTNGLLCHNGGANMDEKSYANQDYSKPWDYSKSWDYTKTLDFSNSNDFSGSNDIYNRITAMIDKTLDTPVCETATNGFKATQDSPCSVADILGFTNQNYSNGIPIVGMNNMGKSVLMPNSGSSYGYNSQGYNSQGYNSQGSSNSFNSFNYGSVKGTEVNSPLSKILTQNWTGSSHGSGGSRAIRATSPSLSYSTDLNSPSIEQALLLGCDAFRENSSSPTESDTSGISSQSELSSLSDIMNNLSLGTQGHQTTVGNGMAMPSFNSNFSGRPDADVSVLSPYFLDRRWSTSSTSPTTSDLDTVERTARLYRNAASFCEPSFTWSGELPPRINQSNQTYSCKVFLGGVPWDITEFGLIETFAPFGHVKVEWPGKGNHNLTSSRKAGYAYVIFESEKQVKALLQACTHSYRNGGSWYYKISSRRMRSKDVQVIPWQINDSNYVHTLSQRMDPSKTVFVGALHGMLTAAGLAHIMDNLFGGVVYAGIDTDKFKYPIGSGRLTFNNFKSYIKAISAAFIEIKTPRFTKRVQLDPYLEDAICSSCKMQQGPIFCRDMACFRYFCRTCWQWRHVDTPWPHKPLMRNKSSH